MFLCEILEKTESKLADRVFDSVAGHPDTLEALLKGCRPDEALLKMLEGTGHRQFFFLCYFRDWSDATENVVLNMFWDVVKQMKIIYYSHELFT